MRFYRPALWRDSRMTFIKNIKIYVFGNLLVKQDSLPLGLLPVLRKSFPQIEFIVVDPNENFPPKNEKNLIIIDTVLGINKPKVLDLNDFQMKENAPISPHDYDLLFHLLLLKKLKKVNRVKIIGIPVKALPREVVIILTSISLLKNGRHSSYKGQKRG